MVLQAKTNKCHNNFTKTENDPRKIWWRKEKENKKQKKRAVRKIKYLNFKKI